MHQVGQTLRDMQSRKAVGVLEVHHVFVIPINTGLEQETERV